jgi:hypothetical protein
VEVKIGVQYAARELVAGERAVPRRGGERRVRGSAADLGCSRSSTTRAAGAGPADKLAYVEIAENEQRRVGFGAM